MSALSERPRSLLQWARASGVVLPTLFLIVMIVAATWFSNAQGVEDIATQGTVGLRAESALSAAATVRNRVALAFVIGQAESAGSATEEDLQQAVARGRDALAELERRVAALVEVDPASTATATTLDLVVTANAILDHLVGPDRSQADRLIANNLEPDYAALATDLAATRQAVLADIELARDSAGRVAGAARIVVAFLLPFAAVLAYRTAIKRAQRRRRLRDALEHERALVLAKDELIANLSHELRTPLTGIVGFAQTAAMDETLNVGELREMSSVIAAEANELSRMVDDLITAARDDQDSLSIRLEPVDPIAELESVLVAAKLADQKVRTDLEAARLHADRLRLRQILRNLISNAIKHGGPDVAVIGVVEGDVYRITVSDDGDGVPEHLIDRLFQRFVHKGDAPITIGSVGLGLSIARRLADLMGGSIGYVRQGGRTEFVLRLPLNGRVRLGDPWALPPTGS